LVEYKKESFELFQSMMERIEDESLRYLFFLQVAQGSARLCHSPKTTDGTRRKTRL